MENLYTFTHHNLLPILKELFNKYFLLNVLILLFLLTKFQVSEGQLEEEKRFRKSYLEPRTREPVTREVKCVANFYQHNYGWKSEICTSRIASHFFKELLVDLSPPNVRTIMIQATIRIRFYWLNFTLVVGPSNQSVSFPLTRSNPRSITTFYLHAGENSTFQVVHWDMFWGSLSVRCKCKDTGTDCSRFALCTGDITVNMESFPNSNQSECQIFLPFGESRLQCHFSYAINRRRISDEQAHTFHYSRTNPLPSSIMSIRVTNNSAPPQTSWIEIKVNSSQESVHSHIVVECQALIGTVLFPLCPEAVNVTDGAALMLITLFPGQMYEFRALAVSLYATERAKENSTVASKIHGFVGPKVFKKVTLKRYINETQVVLTLLLEQDPPSVESHIRVSYYNSSNASLLSLQTETYSLKEHQTDKISSYNISLYLTDTMFVPDQSYNIKVTTLSCLSYCSTGDMVLESNRSLSLSFKAPETPVGPVNVSTTIKSIPGQDSRVLIVWTASQITTQDGFKITLCNEVARCEQNQRDLAVFARTNGDFKYNVTVFLQNLGIYKGKVSPFWNKIFGIGKTFNLVHAPPKPGNFMMKIFNSSERRFVKLTWKMAIRSLYNFTVKLCYTYNFNVCFSQRNFALHNLDNSKLSYNYILSEPLADEVYVFYLKPWYKSLSGKTAEIHFYGNKVVPENKNLIITAILAGLSVVTLTVAIIIFVRTKALWQKVTRKLQKKKVTFDVSPTIPIVITPTPYSTPQIAEKGSPQSKATSGADTAYSPAQYRLSDSVAMTGLWAFLVPQVKMTPAVFSTRDSLPNTATSLSMSQSLLQLCEEGFERAIEKTQRKAYIKMISGLANSPQEMLKNRKVSDQIVTPPRTEIR